MRGRVTNPAPLFNARYHPRLGGGWWSPAVELRLPELSRRPSRRPRPHAVVRGCERGRGALGSSQRLARLAHAMRGPPRALAPRPAGFANRLRGPDRRRNRPHSRALVAARERHAAARVRSEEHTSELQSPCNLVCRLLLEKKKKKLALTAHTKRSEKYAGVAQYGRRLINGVVRSPDQDVQW